MATYTHTSYHQTDSIFSDAQLSVDDSETESFANLQVEAQQQKKRATKLYSYLKKSVQTPSVHGSLYDSVGIIYQKQIGNAYPYILYTVSIDRAHLDSYLYINHLGQYLSFKNGKPLSLPQKIRTQIFNVCLTNWHIKNQVSRAQGFMERSCMGADLK